MTLIIILKLIIIKYLTFIVFVNLIVAAVARLRNRFHVYSLILSMLQQLSLEVHCADRLSIIAIQTVIFLCLNPFLTHHQHPNW